MNLVVFLFSFFLWALGAKTAEVVLTPRPSATLVSVQSIEQANTPKINADTSTYYYKFVSTKFVQNNILEGQKLIIKEEFLLLSFQVTINE